MSLSHYSPPSPPSPPSPSFPAPASPRRAGWVAADVTLVVVEFVLYAGVLCITSTLSLFLGFFSDGCTGDSPCLGAEFGWGFGLAAVGTWVPFLLAVALVILLGVLRRQMWWVPLVAFVLSTGVFLLGVALAVDGATPR
ncbi:MAG TPA: hypothetical protein VN088_06805 [Nocardioides sp.]|nr:hypothetical protein [Nocardioides sp.]